MKPWKALRLTTECGFSQCALDDANDLLAKHFMDNNLKRSPFHANLYVSVDTDDLIRVIDLARAWNMNLQLQHKYEWNEWSVSWRIKDTIEKVTVWSPGA